MPVIAEIVLLPIGTEVGHCGDAFPVQVTVLPEDALIERVALGRPQIISIHADELCALHALARDREPLLDDEPLRAVDVRRILHKIGNTVVHTVHFVRATWSRSFMR